MENRVRIMKQYKLNSTWKKKLNENPMSKMVSLVKGFSNKLFLLSTCLYFIGFLIAKKEGEKGGRREGGKRGGSSFEKKAGGRKRKT